MFTPNLPANPTDRFRLDWYHLSLSEDWCYINKMHAVYYVNESFDNIPNRRGTGGVPLVDTWMIYEDDHTDCRWTEWSTPVEQREDYWKDCFETEADAIKEALVRLNKFIAKGQDRVARMSELADSLRARLG